MAENIRYELILYWSERDQAFIAEVPELPGCAADGATYQEALASVEVVIQEWIETAKELGRPIPVPRGPMNPSDLVGKTALTVQGTVKKPNLFDFATSELTQDAFLCWLLSWAHRQYRAAGEALHMTAIALMNSLLRLHMMEAVTEYGFLEVERQYEDIDILVLANEDIALLIEDKINTSEHSDQLSRYLEIVKEDFPKRKAIPVYLKTGDQGNLKAVEDAGWKCFRRRDFLAVLDHGEKLGVRSDVYADFHSHLRRIEEAVQDYRRRLVRDWGRDESRWTGFFVELQARLEGGNWGKVAFPGNFMGFWWHENGNKYLLLKENQLCFKIYVPEGADPVIEWQSWCEALMVEGRNRGLALCPSKRPSKHGRGKTKRGRGMHLTVAVLDNYLQVDDDGFLDLDRTVSLLRQAENLMDAAIGRMGS